MRLLTLLMIVAAGPVAAHPGHLAGLAGHDHWVAGAALGAAVLVGIWGALKGKRKDDAADPDTGAEPDAGAEPEPDADQEQAA